MYKIYKLSRETLNSDGAVEGILAAAVLYTIIVGLINLCLRAKSVPNVLRWLLIALDLAFVGAFIAVAVLTRPNGQSVHDVTRDPYHQHHYMELPAIVFAFQMKQSTWHQITCRVSPHRCFTEFTDGR